MTVTITKAPQALLIAVVNKLRASLGSYSDLKYLQSRYIDIGVDERVAPAAADKSISVYIQTLGRESLGPTRREDYQLSIAFTSRKQAVPSDMRGSNLLTDTFDSKAVSIQEVQEGIIEAIDGQLDIITAANAEITYGSGFATIPMYLTPNTELKPQEVGPEHFYTQPSSKRSRSVETLEGYLVEIPFIGATRFINTLEG